MKRERIRPIVLIVGMCWHPVAQLPDEILVSAVDGADVSNARRKKK